MHFFIFKTMHTKYTTDISYFTSAFCPCTNELYCSEVKLLSCVQLFVTPCTIAHEVPLFMGFSRQEYWSGLPFLPPGDLSDPGIEATSPTLQVDSFLLSCS